MAAGPKALVTGRTDTDHVTMTAAGVATEPITVFLLEDHDLVRRSVAQLLELEPDMRVVSESATAAGALQAVAESKPDVAMLDD